MRIDPTIKKETLYIGAWTLILSVLMEAVFLILSYWDSSVLFGNLLGAVGAVGNFFCLGLTVQKILGKDEKEAKKMMTTSRTIRMFVLFVLAVLGAVLSCFNIIATLLPLLFPRVAIAFRPLFKNYNNPPEPAVQSTEDGSSEEEGE